MSFVEDIMFPVVIRLCTIFHVVNSNYLWFTTGHKYIPAPAFIKTGMSRDLFNNILSSQKYSK